jgi:hypothetical protein
MKRLGLATATLAAVACSSGHGDLATPPVDAAPPTTLSLEELMDPVTCKQCHSKHYDEWAGSMHAYAAEDPVFIAMNQRGVREGKVGKFCVNCHAPMAVRTGATEDGTNLDALPAKLKGVTCYFCHAVEDVGGTHDNPLLLAHDGVMRGEFRDPVPNTAHNSAYSALHDRDQLASSQLCGTCHDIVNQLDAHVERTFEEWSGTVFAKPPGGTTCSQCHMDQSEHLETAADAPGVFSRRLHSHAFPAVDQALTPFPGAETQAALIKTALDSTLQSALCVRGIGAQATIDVILDNVAAGHLWPSGATQDRRAWVELTAYAGTEKIYESGVVPDGTSITTSTDPDLWLIRDCMVDGAGKEVHMFWEAARTESNQLPGQLTFDPADVRYYQTHVVQTYPRIGKTTLGKMPDKVQMRVRLAAIGLDVIDDLIATKDLDPAYRAKIPIYTLGTDPVLEWTPATANEKFLKDGLPISCISTTNLSAAADKVEATARMLCKP